MKTVIFGKNESSEGESDGWNACASSRVNKTSCATSFEPLNNQQTSLKAKRLFTPGPLSTSSSVKVTMNRDIGSREAEFIGIVRDVRDRILKIGRAPCGFEAILMQGSGTFGVESVISSVIPRDGKLLVITNGAYGRRIADMAKIHGINTTSLAFPENTPAQPSEIKRRLEGEDFTAVAVVHCETTTGILNPIAEIVSTVREVPGNRTIIVDAMSSFGGVELPLDGIDFVISSSNKCVQGVPGLSFVIARKKTLLETQSNARTLSLNLFAQWKGLEDNGQFRFTPPTHAILALNQALIELEGETLDGRIARYKANHGILLEGMRKMGFKEYLEPQYQSHIITSFRYPESANFQFDKFCDELYSRDCVIYPGKVSDANCFRIGTIGHLFPEDFKQLLKAIQTVKEGMKF